VSLLPEPLRIPQFRVFWLARLTWTIGSLAMVIVIGWQVYDIARHTMGLKEAAFRLGLIGLVQFIPLFLLTLVTGWAADRVDRRWIARASVALELACAYDLAGVVRCSRASRRWPRLCRPGSQRTGAEPRAP
jgi:MFS family permease